MARSVFISHTSELRSQPAGFSFVDATEQAILRAGFAVRDMGYFTARDEKPASYCEREVSASDVYVGIIGLRYGSRVRDLPDLSYTELEWEIATNLGLERLIFLLDPGAGEVDPRQQAFRLRLQSSDVTTAAFTTPERLEILVFQALRDGRDDAPEAAVADYLHAAVGAWELLPYQSLFQRLAGAEQQTVPLSTLYVRSRYRRARIGRRTVRGEEESQGRAMTVDEVLVRGAGHLVIYGPPGSGKSCLVQDLCRRTAAAWEAGKSALLPVLVSAGDLDRFLEQGLAFGVAILRAITERLGASLAAPLPESFFTRAPRYRARWLLVIDGVDEIAGDRRRDRLLDAVARHVGRENSPYRFVLTTRPLSALERLGEPLFSHYVLLPFDEAQAAEFARRWFEQLGDPPGSLSEAFLARVSESPIADLKRNPMLLTMAAILFLRGGGEDFPTSRVDLYRELVGRLLGEMRSRRHDETLTELWKSELPFVDISRLGRLLAHSPDLLRALAQWNLSGSFEAASLMTEAFRWAVRNDWLPGDDPFLEDRLKDVLGRLLASSGLMVWEGAHLRFAHKTFQEYLAAEALSSQPPESAPAQELLARWADPHWREVILLALALWSRHPEHRGPIEAWLRIVLRSGRRGGYFAGTALAEGVQMSAELESEVLDAVFDLAGRWNLCVELLSEFRSPDPTDVIRALIDRPGCRQRFLDIVRSGGSGCPPSVGKLFQFGKEIADLQELEALAREAKKDWIRCGAAIALGEAGKVDLAASVLSELARSNEAKEEVRRRSAEALITLGRIEDALRLADDSGLDARIRLAVLVRDFAERRDPATPQRVRGLLDSASPDPETARAVCEILQEQTAVEDLLRDPGVPVSWRIAIAGTLCATGDEKLGVDTLAGLLRDPDLDPETRRSAVAALASAPPGDRARSLLGELARRVDLEPRSRVVAAVGLAAWGQEDALLALAQDEDLPCVYRSDAAVELGKRISEPEGRKILAALFDAPTTTPADRLHIAAGIGLLGDPRESRRRLLSLALGPGASRSVIRQLYEFGFTEELATVARSAEVPVEEREFALRCLRELGQIPFFRELLKERDLPEPITLEAAECLRDLGGFEEAIAAFRRLALGSGTGELRLEAVRHLIRSGAVAEGREAAFAIARDETLPFQLRLPALDLLVDRGEAIEALAALARDERLTGQDRLQAIERIAASELVPQATEILTSFLKPSLPASLQLGAATGLLRLGAKEAKEKARPALLRRLLQSPRSSRELVLTVAELLASNFPEQPLSPAPLLKALGNPRSDLEMSRRAAALLGRTGHVESALRVIRQRPRLSQDLELRLVVELHSAAESWQEALHALEQSPPELQEDWALERQVEISQLADEPERALGASAEKLRRSPDDPDLMLAHVRLLQKALRFQEALDLLERAPVEAETETLAGEKGYCLFELGRMDEALVCIDRALQLGGGKDGTGLWILGMRSLILEALGRLEEAIEMLQVALARDPDYEWAQEQLLSLTREKASV